MSEDDRLLERTEHRETRERRRMGVMDFAPLNLYCLLVGGGLTSLPDLNKFADRRQAPSTWACHATGEVSFPSMPRGRARILWSNPGNPPAAVARVLGKEPRHFSRALHKIKASADLSGTDRVIIYSDGTITDERGEPIGNLYDED